MTAHPGPPDPIPRTIDWADGAVVIVDQTRLPQELRLLRLPDVDALVDAIQRLAVRGAPALGAAGALGVVLAMDQAAREGWPPAQLERALAAIRSARPTAVNLEWGVDRVAGLVPRGRDAVLAEARRIVEEDVAANRALGERGADHLTQGRPARPLRLLTHCNAGSLACVGWGTALGVVRELYGRGLVVEVLVDETRPLLQGSRLTAWELARLGIPYRVLVDGAAAGAIVGGLVDAVVVGADRVAANGDVANKVGTLGLALACRYARIPFVVAAPESTLDPAAPDGRSIPVERRPPAEVTRFRGSAVAPAGSPAYNPAFDVTPAALVDAIVTQRRVVRPALGERPDDDIPGDRPPTLMTG